MALAQRLAARIAAEGPMRLDAWMAACNAAYYAGRDPLGASGDFVTAPEISQMFGEIIGGWIGDLWARAGRPPARLVELGPGRGTLMADAQRVLARLPGFGAAVPLALVETSPVLRQTQQRQLAGEWFDRVEDLPDDRPLIVIANEFFDALPIRQCTATGAERAVGHVAGTTFEPVTIPSALGTPGEHGEAGAAVAAELGARLRRQGGAMLVIDYGYADAVAHDSLQALRHHAVADPFAAPGESDLTAHVDFTALGAAAGLRGWGPVAQGVWLARLGIEARARQLQAGAPPAVAAQVAAALVRLTAPAQMGNLFKVMAMTAPGWPVPAGFEP
ncbi:class I SAM-dependent methyltransferase [Polymorphobacter fuscus]|uniref:Class I SAM-dependent methyltransferase n=1 Tax=Sandarakinorhabdus fusca TaxID=1439888 RepID=A0A7C9GPR8_9SPHN|nr:SAM-dependent methyltransferase [Polymorphobacter fuscus]KAB7647830.1 class I SAM-dependent methyltransferase [Polymorphobacter fuscus]MQT17133.1 class I SAM-dependent methyltransferase [Polymorphobacter fuscus]NJC08874.1 SAM-dependent MidA family methyltransferase [Polymorphobacter fuscus]